MIDFAQNVTRYNCALARLQNADISHNIRHNHKTACMCVCVSSCLFLVSVGDSLGTNRPLQDTKPYKYRVQSSFWRLPN